MNETLTDPNIRDPLLDPSKIGGLPEFLPAEPEPTDRQVTPEELGGLGVGGAVEPFGVGIAIEQLPVAARGKKTPSKPEGDDTSGGDDNVDTSKNTGVKSPTVIDDYHTKDE